MPFVDDVNRILRDHLGYSGDGHGGNGPLPVGDRSTARKPIINRDLRELLIQMAQTMGDPSALATLIAQLADTASRHAIKHFTTQTPEGTGNAAILQTAASQENSPFLNGCLLSVFWPATNTAPDPTATLRGTTYLINRLNGATVQPGDLVGNRPFLFMRYNDERLRLVTPVDAADIAGLTQALADARARANHTGTQPINTVDGLSAALQGLSDAIAAGDTALASALNQNGVKFYDNAAQAVTNGANALPSGIVRIMTIEAWGVAVRSRNTTTDALYGTVPYWGISRRLTTVEAVEAALAAALLAEAAARDTAIGAAVDAEALARQQALATEAAARDTAIGAAVDAEALARQQALATEAEARDTAIGAAVDAEALARQQALATEAEARDTAIGAAVDAEALARQQALATEAAARD
ncbi:MAG: cell envelope integrity protein TolA, partial [Rubrimonas sp.]